MDFVKALIPGSLLTYVVASIFGKNHSKGAWLMVEQMSVQDYQFYWSWPLFAAATVLAWVLFTITPK